tara:strand:- start:586 stop:855 length:270 start_codon:yes stop_codon:yes gene_type:complete
MSKISNVAFRKSLQASGLDSETIDKMTDNAVRDNLVAGSSRVGKLQYAPKDFLALWDKVVEAFPSAKEEWKKNLPSGQSIETISLNCNK